MTKHQAPSTTTPLKNTTVITRIRNRNVILAETLKNWLQFNVPEIIIVDFRDDGCESAWDVVSEVSDSRVKVVETKYEYMFCPSIAWNLGIAQANTEYVLLMDVDDTMEPHFFETNVLIENGYICGQGMGSLTGICYIKQEYLNAVGGFSENMLYMGTADWDLYERLRNAGYSQCSLSANSAKHKNHPVTLKIINQLQDTSRLQNNGNSYNMWRHFNYLNVVIGKMLPWSETSPRIQWNVTELEMNRYLALRDVVSKRQNLLNAGDGRYESKNL